MIKAIALVLSISLLSGCSSLELRNLGKSVASGGVGYVISPLAGAAVLATSMAYDEIIPDEPNISEIKTSEQAVAFVATGLATDALYAFIAFLLITNVVVPWVTRRNGYAKAKKKYKDVEFKSDMKL